MTHSESPLPSLFTPLIVLSLVLFLQSCSTPQSSRMPVSSSAVGSSEVGSRGYGYVPGASADATSVVEKSKERHGLGTGWGHRTRSSVDRVNFQRQSGKPDAVVTAHYNDEVGIAAMAKRLGTPARLRKPLKAGGLVTWGVMSASGKMLPTYEAGDRILVEGESGGAYSLYAKNEGDRYVEVVFSVDGLDVMDGKAASPKKRGYLIAPGKELRIRGWRQSDSYVATFEFSSVADSYSEEKHGTSRNVGVIGLAVFSEHHLAHYERIHRLEDTAKRDEAEAFPEL